MATILKIQDGGQEVVKKSVNIVFRNLWVLAIPNYIVYRIPNKILQNVNNIKLSLPIQSSKGKSRHKKACIHFEYGGHFENQMLQRFVLAS